MDAWKYDSFIYRVLLTGEIFPLMFEINVVFPRIDVLFAILCRVIPIIIIATLMKFR